MLVYMARAALIGATATAVALAWRRVDHRSFAVFLTVIAAASLIRSVLPTIAPIRPLESPPFTGAARLAFHADQALFLTWPAGLTALAILLFAGRRPFPMIALLWAGAVAYLIARYPTIRGETLRRFYLAAELAALAGAVASLASFWQRRATITPAHTCALLCFGADAATLGAGAWRWGFWVHWELTQITYALLYTVLLAFQGVLCSSHSRSP